MIDKIISERRAIFPVQFSKGEMSREEIQKLLEAANWAPTHKRTEPWRFKVFHSLESRQNLSNFLSEIYKKTAVHFSEVKQRKMAEKPLLSACVIAICMQRDPHQSLPEWEEIAATAMAVQNLWLQATEMRLGGYWSSPGLIEHLGEHIQLEAGERCIGFFYLGKYDEPWPEGKRNSLIKEKTVWY
jgi:nitroreductase